MLVVSVRTAVRVGIFLSLSVCSVVEAVFEDGFFWLEGLRSLWPGTRGAMLTVRGGSREMMYSDLALLCLYFCLYSVTGTDSEVGSRRLKGRSRGCFRYFRQSAMSASEVKYKQSHFNTIDQLIEDILMLKTRTRLHDTHSPKFILESC